jgi:hypothetical protein
MEIELTERLRRQVDIVLGLYDFSSGQDEETTQEWLRYVRDIPGHLYAGASQGYLEVFLTRVLVDVIDARSREAGEGD